MIDYLSDLGQAIVNAGIAGLAVATTGRTAPTGYVVHAPVVCDINCGTGQLTVHLAQVFLSAQDDESTNARPFPGNCCAGVWKATFVLTLLRCIGNLDAAGRPVTSTTQADDASDLLEDLWALLTQLDDQMNAGTLFPVSEFPGVRCQDITVGVAVPIPIEGNCAGWEIPLTVRLNDAGPTGS